MGVNGMELLTRARRKGSVGKIRITVQSRGGKKFVTCIHSVERFGIDPDNLSRLLRSEFAASCSVTSQFVSNAVGEEKVLTLRGCVLMVQRITMPRR